MDLSPTVLAERARSDFGAKAIRYSAVSVIAVIVTQIVLVICDHDAGFGLSATTSNVIAVTVASVPSYALNRSWVWRKRGKNHLTREVLPFWAFALAGLVVSTLLVAVVARWNDRTLAVMGANVVGFGLLWVAKFFVLERLLFGPHHHAVDALSLVDEDELEADEVDQPTSSGRLAARPRG